MHNLYQHIRNIREKFGLNVIVAINKYSTDMQNELQFIKEDLQERQIPVSLVEGWAEGGEGATDIARKLTELVKLEQNFKFIYKDSDDIKTKIEMVAKEIYGAIGVDFSEDAIKEINRIEKLGYSNLPVCIAKTQYSFSDDAKI